jgi:hypothetical protein
MRPFLVSAVMGLSSAGAVIAFVIGALVIIAAFNDTGVASWYGLFAGLMMLILGTTFAGVALIAYLAGVVADTAVIPEHAQPFPPVDPARRPSGIGT